MAGLRLSKGGGDNGKQTLHPSSHYHDGQDDKLHGDNEHEVQGDRWAEASQHRNREGGCKHAHGP